MQISTYVNSGALGTASPKKIDIQVGDTVRVHQKIKEGEKKRIQVFEGLVIAKRHGNEPGATITMRKISQGVGVERTFPIYLPTIEKFEVTKRAKVRRAKLYYLRKKTSRQIRKKIKSLQVPGESLVFENQENQKEEKVEKQETATPETPDKAESNNKFGGQENSSESEDVKK